MYLFTWEQINQRVREENQDKYLMEKEAWEGYS
jgi:hypothetical protein